MNTQSASQPTALVLKTQREKHEFLPPDLEARLRGSFSDLTWVEALLQDVEWYKLLRDLRPEIVLCAWETPSLPLEAYATQFPVAEWNF